MMNNSLSMKVTGSKRQIEQQLLKTIKNGTQQNQT